MSPEAQNIAICEAWGRSWHRPTAEELKSGSYYQYEPDFTRELGVIQRVCEDVLTDDEWDAMADALFAARTAGGRFPYRYPSVLLRADASTWCRALLKVKGLWKDGAA